MNYKQYLATNCKELLSDYMNLNDMDSFTEEEYKEIYEELKENGLLKEETNMLKANVFVSELSEDIQSSIAEEIMRKLIEEGFSEVEVTESVEVALSSRLSALSDVINVKEYLNKANA